MMESIDVIVPIYKGKRWIQEFFHSISHQTLKRSAYRVICVFNGPDDGAYKVLMDQAAAAPSLRITAIHEPRLGASRARQTGLELGRAPYVTFLDVDDLVSTTFLENLVSYSAPNTMAMAWMVDVNETGDELNTQKPIAQDLLKAGQRRVRPERYRRAFSFMTAKAFPRSWAMDAGLPLDLPSGEDVAFYGRILARNDFKLDLSPGLAGATYFRRTVAQSVSRGRSDFDFMVHERALVIQDLSLSLSNSRHAAQRSVIKAGMAAQAGFIRRYLRKSPHKYRQVIDYLIEFHVQEFPWWAVVPEPEDLAIAYNFVPYADTGAIVASKRIREAGRPVDVISNDMSARRDSMPENMLLARPYISKHRELKAPTSFSHPDAILKFVRQGLNHYKYLSRKNGRPYRRIYSRSMWPASHFLAAQIKKQVPQVEWTAEFSDPVKLAVTGELRTVDIAGSDLSTMLLAGLDVATQAVLSAETNLFAWTELLPFTLADSLVFTNENQREIMMDHTPQALHQRINDHSQISPHPTLPRPFYELFSHSTSTSDKLRIGYFGEFYVTRGLSEVLEAINRLDDDSLDHLEFHVFSTDSPQPALEALGVRPAVIDCIKHQQKVPYFRFLSTLDTFDVLLVNDAITADHHKVNPYLPSKYSDYKGAISRIWTLSEPNSILSGLPCDYGSIIGDVEGALSVLKKALADHVISATTEGPRLP